MNVISSWWNRLGLRLKLQIMIQGFLILILGTAQAWISARFEQQVLADAQARAHAVADGAINGLNTLMVTKLGGDFVISDKVARALFIKKMGAADKVEELRIVRDKSVDAEFGSGLPDTQPIDETDRRVLASGRPEFKLLDRADKVTLRAVLPFVATKDYRGTNCLNCHAVNEGAVLGAASVVVNVQDEMATIKTITAWIWAGQLVLQLVCAVVLYFVACGVVGQIGGEPKTAVSLTRLVAQGDLTTKLNVRRNDTSSLMASLQDMQTGLVSVVSGVRTSAESLAVSSAQIAQGNLDLSRRTEGQASALEETAAAMEELSATVKQNADNAEKADQLAHSACAVAVTGGEVVSQVVDTMKGINDSSKKIADIISVIDGIAFQTNILALNAAVEAARAGEQGRGFAVVASEVRSLAGRSAEAAKEIKSLIMASVERVEHGTALVDRAGATMTDVVTSIRRVTDIMREISTASAEQSAGVAQVGVAISQMDQTTQQNAALVEQGAAAAESLRVQAQELVQAVAAFKLNQDAAERAAPAHAKAAEHRGPNQATSVMRTQSGTTAAPAGLKVSAAASPAQDAQVLTA